MVYAYLRVSTAGQENSMDSQRRAIELFIRQKSITKEIRFFEDLGVSGSKSSRPGLDDLMGELRKGQVTTLVCYSISRLGRSVIHLLTLIQELDTLGVTVHSVTESLDTKSPFGRLILNLLASLAQMERELIAGRVVNGLRAARERGKKLGRPTKVNRNIVRALVVQGLKYREISKLTGASHWLIREVVKEVNCSESTNSEQNTLVG